MPMTTTSVLEFHQLLKDNMTSSVIDVRTPVEFAEVHVPAAKNVPLSTLDPA